MNRSLTRHPPPALPSSPTFVSLFSSWGLAEFFVVSQTAIPALLFLPGTQSIRLYVRVASFAVSMGLLAWWAFGDAKTSRRHPSQPWLVASMLYLGVMVLHPFTSSTLGGLGAARVTCRSWRRCSGRRRSSAVPTISRA